MSDSGFLEQSSNDNTNKVEALKALFERDDVFDISRSNGNLVRKPYLSRSVMNLTGATTSTPYSSRMLSRSESSSTLASPIESLSLVPVTDKNSLTSNYQTYQTSRDIKQLFCHAQQLEQKQEKISRTKVNLSWNIEKQDLMKANDELTTEVERLQKVEEEKDEEIETLKNQIIELHDKFSVLNLKHLEEQNKLISEIDELTESLSIANDQSTRILDKVKSVEESHANDKVKFGAKINFLEKSLNKEKALRKDFEKSKYELETSTFMLQDKVAKLNEEYEELESENIDLAVENSEWKNNQEHQLEKEQNLSKEISQLSIINQLLLDKQKLMFEKNEEDLEKITKELKNESDKVEELSILNKTITAENEWLQTNLKLAYQDFETVKNEVLEEKERMMNPIIRRFWKHPTPRKIISSTGILNLPKSGILKV